MARDPHARFGPQGAKVVAPASKQPALRLIDHTHPEYAVLLAAFAQPTGADAMLLRRTEGKPVADARRLPRLDVFIHGKARADLARLSHDGVRAGMPLLPRALIAWQRGRAARQGRGTAGDRWSVVGGRCR